MTITVCISAMCTLGLLHKAIGSVDAFSDVVTMVFQLTLMLSIWYVY